MENLQEKNKTDTLFIGLNVLEVLQLQWEVYEWIVNWTLKINKI